MVIMLPIFCNQRSIINENKDLNHGVPAEKKERRLPVSWNCSQRGKRNQTKYNVVLRVNPKLLLFSCSLGLAELLEQDNPEWLKGMNCNLPQAPTRPGQKQSSVPLRNITESWNLWFAFFCTSGSQPRLISLGLLPGTIQASCGVPGDLDLMDVPWSNSEFWSCSWCSSWLSQGSRDPWIGVSPDVLFPSLHWAPCRCHFLSTACPGLSFFWTTTEYGFCVMGQISQIGSNCWSPLISPKPNCLPNVPLPNIITIAERV